MMQLRRGRPSDATAIAEVHVAGWRWGYRDLLPEGVLAALSLERRRRAWEHTLADATRWLWVAERDGAVVGFVAAGPARDDRGAEVYALYQLEHVAGSGVGHALLERAQQEARARGFDDAMLWVLETNARARAFYERCGWTPDGGHKVDTLEGVKLAEVRYRRSLER